MSQRAYRSDEDATTSIAPPRTDEERRVIAALRAGDSVVFEWLFSSHYDALCAFVYSYVRSRETTEDLVQDLFASIWENRDRWLPGGTIRQYLFTAARNRALTYLRHEVVVRRFEDVAARDPVLLSDGRMTERADDLAHFDELTTAFEDAVRALPAKRRRVLLLRWEAQLTHAEIAHVLGISVKGVETQIGRAMRFIRERLASFRPRG